MKKLLIFICSVALANTALSFNVKTKTFKNSNNTTHIRMEADVTSTSTSSNKVDILFVIDNSGSMRPHLYQITNHVHDALQPFSSYDTNAAVIISSMKDNFTPYDYVPGGGKFINGFTNSYSDTHFMQTLQKNFMSAVAISHGFADEEFFNPILAALYPPLATTVNSGFLRADAKLVVLFITDAEDQSANITPEEFVTRLQNLKPQSSDSVYLAGVFVGSNDTCSRDNISQKPVRLEAAMNNMKSFFTSLCSDNLRVRLNAMSNNIINEIGVATQKNRSFKLPLKPNLSTLKVSYDKYNLAAGDFQQGWYYDHLSMILNIGEDFDYNVAPAGTKLVIEYDSAQ